MVIDRMNKAKFGKKDLNSKKNKPDQNAPVNKNCEIFMCDMNEKIDGKNEQKLMKELERIFQNTKSVSKTRIGAESMNAFALILNGYHDNRIVIKIPRKTDGSVDSLKYEYSVGCHIRKTLCKNIPNFMKVYGYIHKNNSEYLILQRVLPGKTLRELVKDSPSPKFNSMNSKELMSIILQTLCSVQVAQNAINFTHYDLHFGNVIIKEDKESPKEIKYTYTDKKNVSHTVTVPVYENRIAVIIDYGRTHTSKSPSFFKKNPECFKPYKFLTDKKRMTNIVDIRTFDPEYDTKRFCKILQNYLKNTHDFKFDFFEDIDEPHDVIVRLIDHSSKIK